MFISNGKMSNDVFENVNTRIIETEEEKMQVDRENRD